MYRAPSKRRQLIIRSFVYSLMTIGVVVLVTVLVFLMLGYRFNKSTSSIQQGGLVQFASRPIDASVTIGKAKLTDLTPSKITVNPGKYDVAMSRKGYRDWNKNVNVRAGEVLWLNYAQLVPNTIETTSLLPIDKAYQVKSSPNGDRFAIITDPAKATISYVDVTGDTPKRTDLSLPSSIVPAGKTVTYGLADWANDSDRMLVTMSYDNVIDYVLVDRRDGERSVNLSRTYTQDISQPIFDPRSSERLFVRSAVGELRLIDTSAKSLSKVLATNITHMSLYGNDAFMLVQSVSPVEQTVGYLSLGEDEVRVLKRVASADKVIVAAGNYFSEPHIAITVASQLEVLRARSLPSSTSDASISLSSIDTATLPANPLYLSVRSGGRFVVAQYDSGVQTYDIELSKRAMTNFKSTSVQELRWTDRYHFYTTMNNQLEVVEFDGANPQQITALTTGFDAVQSDDGKYLYSINAAATGFTLQRSQLILD